MLTDKFLNIFISLQNFIKHLTNKVKQKKLMFFVFFEKKY